VEPQQQRHTDRHVGIAGEVEVDLDGECQHAAPRGCLNVFGMVVSLLEAPPFRRNLCWIADQEA
jgi:hypothetical protein